MVCVLKPGLRSWGVTRDAEGHREYKASVLVSAAVEDGPAKVLNTPGLPRPGQRWNYYNDLDVWAYCRNEMTVSIHHEKEGDPNRWWKVDLTYSTKPRNRCQDDKVEDPLLEPQKVSGRSQKVSGLGTEEAVADRFGRAICNSAWEPFKGAVVEFDRSQPTIRIEQNVATLNAALCYSMVNTVNDRVLWGQPRRTVRLSNFDWERKYHGLCYKYYTRVFDFEVESNTFDRDILDEGTKVLKGHWNRENGEWVLDQIGGQIADKNNPANFIRFKDIHGENSRVILNGEGVPAYVVASGSTTVWVSIEDNHFAKGLKNDNFWRPVVGPWLKPPVYDGEKAYVRGNVVELNFGAPGDQEFWIADKARAPGQAPPDFWIPLGNDFTDAGTEYRNEETYNKGDYLTLTNRAETSAGYIHVEKYDESNFLLLGIPLVF